MGFVLLGWFHQRNLQELVSKSGRKTENTIHEVLQSEKTLVAYEDPAIAFEGRCQLGRGGSSGKRDNREMH